MKRHIAVLVVTGVLLVGPAGSASALNREPGSPQQSFRASVIKAVKQLKNVFRISTADYPTLPKPCTPGEPGCP